MNLRTLAYALNLSAQFATDKDLEVQVTDCFRILNTAYPEHSLSKVYTSSNESHPLVQWAKSNVANAWYVYRMAVTFADEYKVRFGKPIGYSYPFAKAERLFNLDYPLRPPTNYPMYVPEYIRRRVHPGYSDYLLGETPYFTKGNDRNTDLTYCYTAYEVYYVLEQSCPVWSNGVPKWYSDMCVKLGRTPF